MTDKVPRLITSGVMARELDVPLHRIIWILATRGIQPTARAGTLRLYSRHAFNLVRDELAAIDAQRKEAVHD